MLPCLITVVLAIEVPCVAWVCRLRLRPERVVVVYKPRHCNRTLQQYNTVLLLYLVIDLAGPCLHHHHGASCQSCLLVGRRSVVVGVTWGISRLKRDVERRALLPFPIVNRKIRSRSRHLQRQGSNYCPKICSSLLLAVLRSTIDSILLW
jgi:hypothetical protein